MDILSAYGNQLKVEFDPWYKTYEGEHVGRIDIRDPHGRLVQATRTFEQAVDGWTPKGSRLEWLSGETEWRDGKPIMPNRISVKMVDSIVLWILSIMQWELKGTTDDLSH